MRVVVLGTRGMLGSYVKAEVQRRALRSLCWAPPHFAFGGAWPVWGFEHGDVVINCIGAIPEKERGDIDMVVTNAVLPHVLAFELPRGARMIHVSTDCVFSGPGPFSSAEAPAPTDLYGRSKLAGEVQSPHVLNVRTSFVGPEHGLWRWVNEQPSGATIEGWGNAIWTGSTVKAVAGALVDLALGKEDDWLVHTSGVIHLATNRWWSKAEVVHLLAMKMGREDLTIVSKPSPAIDRRLLPDMGLQDFGEALREW